MSSSESAPRPRSREIALNAWMSCIDACKRMPVLATSALVSATVMFSVQDWLLSSWQSYWRPLSVGGTMPLLGQTMGYALAAFDMVTATLVFVPPVVVIHRFVLLGETAIGLRWLLSQRIRRFFYWMFAIELFVLVISIFGILALKVSGGLFFGSVYYLVSLLVILVVAVRLILIFPSVALETPSPRWQDRVELSWRQTRGNSWLIYLSFFLAQLPFLIVRFLSEASKVFGGEFLNLGGWTLTQALGNSFPAPLLVGIENLFRAGTELAAFALTAAVASLVYRYATQQSEGRGTQGIADASQK